MNINKKIIILILEMIIVSLFVLISIPIREKTYANTKQKQNFYNNYISDNSTELDFEHKRSENQISSLNDENGLENVIEKLKITNSFNENKKYKLYIKIYEETTLDVKNISIGVNKEKINLSRQYKYTKNKIKYYEVDSNFIKSKETKNIDISIWINENSESIENKTLAYELELK